MKNITIIGIFSNADWLTSKNKAPVLAKMIESIRENEDFRIGKILLIYGCKYENGKHISDDKIIENLSQTAQVISDERIACYLKNPIIRQIPDSKEQCDYTSDDDGLYLWIPETNKNTNETCYFYDEFIKIMKSAKCQYYYLNLTSGNIQSREAIQFLPTVFSQKNFYIFTENKIEPTHKTDPQALEWIKGEKDGIEEECKLSDYKSRVSFKSKNSEMYKHFIENTIQYNIEQENFFTAYYHLKENESLFGQNTIDLFDSCFLPFTSIKYHDDYYGRYYITEQELAEYFLHRLMYISALKGKQKYSKLTMNVLSDLLYTLYHLSTDENGKCQMHYLTKEGDEFVFNNKNQKDNEESAKNIGKKYTSNTNDIYGNGPLNNYKFINFNLKKYPYNFNFCSIYNQYRHPNDPKYKKCTEEQIRDYIDQLISNLKDLFVTKFKSHTKYYECDTFKKIKTAFKNDLISVVRVRKKPTMNQGKTCYLSLMGSTDPGNIRLFDDGNRYFMYGSTLCFSKDLSNEKNKDFDELRRIKKKNGLPYYLICTKEIANAFCEHNIEVADLEKKELYNSEIHLLPFINKDDISINQSYSFSEVKDLCKDMTDYSLNACFSICTQIIDQLLSLGYDNIYIMESSGLPYVKMSFTYLSYVHQDKIKILECKDPSKAYESELDIKHSKYKIPNSIAADELITAKQHLASAVQAFNDKYRSTLLDYIKTGSLIPTYLFLYQTQKTTMDHIFSANTDFMNELNHSITEAAKNIPQSEEDFITSTEQDNKLINALVKAKYCLQYKEEIDAVLGLDFCFEYLVGHNLKKYIVDNADATTSNFYKTLIENGSIAETEDCEVKKYVEHALGELIKNDLKYLFSSITRKSSVYYIAIYYYLKKVNVDTAKKNIKEFDLVWEQCSNLKHNSDSNNGVLLTNETLSNIIDFLNDSQRELLETWCNHYSFVKNAIKEKYKVYLVSEK